MCRNVAKISNCLPEIVIAQSPFVTQGSGALKNKNPRVLIREHTVYPKWLNACTSDLHHLTCAPNSTRCEVIIFG